MFHVLMIFYETVLITC